MILFLPELKGADTKSLAVGNVQVADGCKYQYPVIGSWYQMMIHNSLGK